MRTSMLRKTGGGTNNPADTIFDARSEPGIGMVLFEPYLKEPFTYIPEGK